MKEHYKKDATAYYENLNDDMCHLPPAVGLASIYAMNTFIMSASPIRATQRIRPFGKWLPATIAGWNVTTQSFTKTMWLTGLDGSLTIS